MTRLRLRDCGVVAASCALLLACAAARAAGEAAPPEPSEPPAPPAGVAPPARVIPSPSELEAQGAVIGRIVVVTDDVFDPSIPGESGWLYRTANRLHVNTRPSRCRSWRGWR